MERTDGVMRLDLLCHVVGREGNRFPVGEKGVEEEAYPSEEEACISTPGESGCGGRRGDGVFTPSKLSEPPLIVGVGGMRGGDGATRGEDAGVVIAADATKERGAI